MILILADTRQSADNYIKQHQLQNAKFIYARAQIIGWPRGSCTVIKLPGYWRCPHSEEIENECNFREFPTLETHDEF